MLPLAELSQRIAWGDPTLATLRGHNRLFIRPDSPTKPFPGNVHSVPNLIHLQNVIKRDYSDQMLVVVAPEQPIEAEWRAVIADGQVLTASQYKQNNQPKYCLGLPDAVQALAKTVAGGWQPDPIWILDLGWVDGAAYIVEIGMFSCAAFYHCDLSSIVEAASTIAQLKWADQPYQP